MVVLAANQSTRNPNAPIRVLIVAAYPIARAGLAALLGGVADVEVVGQAAGGAALPKAIAATTPDLLLLDQLSGDEETLERLETILRDRTDLVALILGAEGTEEATIGALSIGARGFLPRESSGEELVAAVRAVAAGLLVLHPIPAAAFLERLIDRPRVTPLTGPGEALTPRELEVLQALAGGLTNRAIARRLTVSENTIKFHVSSILTKLDAASRAEAVAVAAKRGLLLL